MLPRRTAPMPVWATCIAGRSPTFKPHTQASHALNAAMQYRREVWVYKLVDGEWQPWFYWDGVTDRPEWMQIPTKDWQHMDSLFQVIIEEFPV